MKRWLGWAAGAAAMIGVSTVAAEAVPLAPAPLDAQGVVTLVRDGCGPGGFRNRFGECRYRGGGYRGDGFYGDRGRGFYGPPRFGGGYYGRRCFIRETYYGPRRVCR